jgi:putative transposase
MDMVAARGPALGVAPLCRALELSRATVYRARDRAHNPVLPGPRPKPVRALSDAERQAVLDTLHEKRFVDQPPAQVYATLLDANRYLCSERTMYRILEAEGEVRERRNQIEHPPYAKPELLATGPNEVWSWDITKLKGPAKWTYFYLYVILDIFSRYTVGWMVATHESATLAKRLIADTCEKQAIVQEQLTLHADRGSSMKSKCVAQLLSDLGITKTHSRPHVSNDNPFSESQFKTLKYRPQFPARFGCLQDARALCADFFAWYNTQHHHSALGLLTPEDVHYGRGPHRVQARQQVLNQAYAQHPERFVRNAPQAPQLPDAVWINPPARSAELDKEQLVDTT